MQSSLSAREFAERYRVGLEKVLRWIRLGQLQAVNIANDTSARPQYRITPEACRAFEEGRAVVKPEPRPAKKRRREEAVAGWTDRY